MVRAAAVVGVLTLATLAGCGTTARDDGTIPPGDSATQSASITPTAPVSSSTAPAPAPWVAMRDDHSGVRFRLPTRAKPKRTSSPLPSWTYTAPDPGDPRLKVAVSIVRYGPTDIATVISTLVGIARNAGIADAQGSDLHQATVDGRAAQAGKISWPGSGSPSGYMTVTAVPSGQYAVLAEVTGTSSGPPQYVARQVRALTMRLVASISLP